MEDYIIVIISSYLIGSVPFGLILTKLTTNTDIRQHGSGNIGATNVLRTAGKKLGAITLLLDTSKGIIATYATYILYPHLEAYAALFSILGHIFPCWLEFKGGKGVATAIGTLSVCYLPTGLCMATIWLSIFKLTKISSLSSIGAMLIAPIFTYCMTGYSPIFILNMIVSAIVIAKHYQNIKRLIQGEEKMVL
jgi:glycerol-3-phosphate acyltransferase PlsY